MKTALSTPCGTVVALLIGAGCTRTTDEEPAERTVTVSEVTAQRWEPARTVPASPELLRIGKTAYEKQCASCHGQDGKGDGPAAYLLYPKPRDFVRALYRLVSPWERIPTDEDIYRTISRGMPGSAMPPWSHLPERTRWGLVHYIKSFASEPMVVSSPTPDDPQQGILEVPPEPPYTEEAKARAAQLFADGCAPCHGDTGKGDGTQEQIDSRGFPTQPRDLTAGVYKGVPAAEHVYRRIVLGLPGTPMPMNAYLHGDDAWHLVHYVLEMSSEEQRRRIEMRKLRIVARRTARLPIHPDDGGWRDAPAVRLPLMPLWWRAQRPEELTVQVLHDGREIAFQLTWFDQTHDHTAMRPQDFRDAAAIEFSLKRNPPFFAMGAAGEFVNIWMWKSERQADLEPAYQDLEKVYPNIGIDSYPNLMLSPREQPLRHALTLRSDSTFVTAWGAGNIVSDPTRKSPAEDLLAQGFGTLSALPTIDQKVEATGIYSTGTYRVVFRRILSERRERTVTFRPRSTVPVAFAVWNGSAGDRDGKKSVTVWQDLMLE